jgi:hypothetical protein
MQQGSKLESILSITELYWKAVGYVRIGLKR